MLLLFYGVVGVVNDATVVVVVGDVVVVGNGNGVAVVFAATTAALATDVSVLGVTAVLWWCWYTVLLL